MFSAQNTEQHSKKHKTQTKIKPPSTTKGSSYRVSLKQTSRDDTKPMESQYKHGWFGMRETNQEDIPIARNEERESVLEEMRKIRCRVCVY